MLAISSVSNDRLLVIDFIEFAVDLSCPRLELRTI
jgi:hypothetical protein